MTSTHLELRERALAANLEIPRRGLAIYTFGNVSAFDAQKGVLAIKPSGVPYERLTADDMVVVDLEGKVVEGRLRPSSDTPTHVVLYSSFQGVAGIVHTHSTYATAWAQARAPIPIYGTTHADHLAEDVPCTEVMRDEAVAGDYETETGNQILECFKERNPLHTPMVLVAGHGAFTWGEDAEQGGLQRGGAGRARPHGLAHPDHRPRRRAPPRIRDPEALRKETRQERLLRPEVRGRCAGH